MDWPCLSGLLGAFAPCPRGLKAKASPLSECSRFSSMRKYLVAGYPPPFFERNP